MSLNDAQFLADGGNFPQWPLCPVVRKGDAKVGIVVDGEIAVYVGANIWALSTGTLSEILAPFEKKVYSDWEALTDEWRVD